MNTIRDVKRVELARRMSKVSKTRNVGYWWKIATKKNGSESCPKADFGIDGICYPSVHYTGCFKNRSTILKAYMFIQKT
jgi:hypothetical protein